MKKSTKKRLLKKLVEIKKTRAKPKKKKSLLTKYRELNKAYKKLAKDPIRLTGYPVYSHNKVSLDVCPNMLWVCVRADKFSQAQVTADTYNVSVHNSGHDNIYLMPNAQDRSPEI